MGLYVDRVFSLGVGLRRGLFFGVARGLDLTELCDEVMADGLLIGCRRSERFDGLVMELQVGLADTPRIF